MGADERRALRNFGLVLAAFLALVFGTALPLLGWLPFVAAIWAIAGALVLAALVWPPAVWPVHAGWTAVGRVLGWVNTRVLLGVVFFALIWPMGAVRRLFGHAVPRTMDRAALSYRTPSAPQRDPDHFERPF